MKRQASGCEKKIPKDVSGNRLNSGLNNELLQFNNKHILLK